ncbi:MAG: leucine-rich repeat domain-containing protein [Clostridia bacterium]|nr:leucine-rich repeat domain-containing protein [Clostridia bacterium]
MKKEEKRVKRPKVDPIQAPPPEIPEDEIWTYRIEGLQEPHIGGRYKHSASKKVLVVAALLVAIGLSIFLSVRAIHKDTFQYKELQDGSYELVKFSNPGDIHEMTIDCVDGDAAKPVTVLHEYMLNCDDQLQTVRIGASVTQIDGKSFYSCWNLQAIFVDENNPNYCDLDGVLYTKDLSEILCYPIDRDLYLREKAGIENELFVGDPDYSDDYVQKVQTYALPQQTKRIGMLAFNYSDLVRVELPHGLESIETMAFFRCVNLREITTRNGDSVYASLPECLTFIGSDAFSYDQALTYMYIPEKVAEIGHHAFWDTVYKDGGNIAGLSEICVQADEASFKKNVRTGDQWRGEYDHMLFKKAVPVRYGAQREGIK